MPVLILEGVLLIALIGITIGIIFGRNLLAATIIYCAFSLTAMLLYTIAGAADVAFTEAIIGTISTVYFIIAIRSIHRSAADKTEEKKMDEKKNRKKMAITLTAIIIITAASAAKIGSFLPFIGKLDTPANANVSAYYISNAVEDTHAHNIVTAVLADYRGFDTLFETCVLFLSGVAAMTTLSTKKRLPRLHGRDLIEKNKKSLFGSAINDAAFRIVVPIILIYALYVLFHGEVSLGGGFQAGALLACAYLLDRIILTFDMRTRKVREETGLLIGAAGGLLYIMTGIITMIFGGTFLDYDYLPFNAENPAELHADGILMIEIGVTVCVAGVIIAILEVVLERTDFDD